MHTVGAFEAKTHLSELLEEVQSGGQIVITKHGHPVAKLVPFEKNTLEEKGEAINTLKALALTHTLHLDWKKLRDEGRR